MIPFLPDEIADYLDDANPASDAASDAVVAAFLAAPAHNDNARPELLRYLIRGMTNKIAIGESRHMSCVSAYAGAMKEARAGYYSARVAREVIGAVFIAAVSRDPVSGKQGSPRTGRAAVDELNGIEAWGVGQALASDLDEVHARIRERAPERLDWTTTAGQLQTDPATAPVAETVVERPATVDGATFILDEPDTIPALWGRDEDVLWASGEAMMIAGPMGLGKTTAAGQLVRGLLFGGDMLGLPITALEDDEVILILAMDRPRQIARSMGRQFGEEHRDILARRVRVRKGPPPADVAANPALLTVMAQSEGARVVFVDSLKDAAIGLSDDQVGAGYNRARQMLLASGRELCELHHVVKRNPNGGAPSSAADIYGSTWLTAGCGSVILLTGEPGDPIVGFRHVKQPAQEVGPFRLFHDQAAGRLTVDHVADLVALVKASGPDGLTAKAAAAALFDKAKPTAADVQKARRKLDALVETKALSRMEGGKGQGNVTAWFEP
jgi:hypothetical protein